MKKVIVLGSINMDVVLRVDQHPKIGETRTGNTVHYFLGGKGANQAIASARTAANTHFYGKVGTDDYGRQLLKMLEQEPLTNHVNCVENASSGSAYITVSEKTSDNSIIVIPGANHAFNLEDVEQLPLEKGDLLLAQYEIPHAIIEHAFEFGRKIGTINVFNPAPAQSLTDHFLNLIDLLVLNETELEILLNSTIDWNNETAVHQGVNALKKPHQTIILTRGEKGAIVFSNEATFSVEGHPVTAIDTTGAGDCFTGTLVAFLANSASLTEAVKMANKAASICVTKPGASPAMPTLAELLEENIPE